MMPDRESIEGLSFDAFDQGLWAFEIDYIESIMQRIWILASLLIPHYNPDYIQHPKTYCNSVCSTVRPNSSLDPSTPQSIFFLYIRDAFDYSINDFISNHEISEFSFEPNCSLRYSFRTSFLDLTNSNLSRSRSFSLKVSSFIPKNSWWVYWVFFIF